MGFYSCNKKEVPQRVPLNKTESLCRGGYCRFSKGAHGGACRVRVKARKERSDGIAIVTVRSIASRAVSSDRRAVPKTEGTETSVPSVFGATGRIRTGDLLITNQLLYQLSHSSTYIYSIRL